MLNAMLVQRADMIGEDCERLSVECVRDLQDAHNTECDDSWYTSDELPNHVTIIDGEEFIERYV
jgi:hypothetical protein